MQFLKVIYIILLFSLVLLSCERKEFPVDDSPVVVINKGVNTVDSIKGTLIIDENFQKWELLGYNTSSSSDFCKYLMVSANTISYSTKEVQVQYSKIKVSYYLRFFAANPFCGNDAGTSGSSSEISTGYIALQAPIHYKCFGHNVSAGAFLETSILPSVTSVSFSMSYSFSDVDYIQGITLWKKGVRDSDFIKIKDFSIITNPLDSYDTVVNKKITGQVFNYNINEDSVKLRFTCRWPKGIEFNTIELNQLKLLKNDLPAEFPIVNRAVKIHDLKIWSND